MTEDETCNWSCKKSKKNRMPKLSTVIPVKEKSALADDIRQVREGNERCCYKRFGEGLVGSILLGFGSYDKSRCHTCEGVSKKRHNI